MAEPIIYDKAEFHQEGNFPADLPPSQALIHIGMFLGWLCDQGLFSKEMSKDFREEIALFQQRKISGSQLLEISGGALVSEMLTKKGNAFTAAYYDADQEAYLDDYAELLAQGLPSVYHVEDTWENYETIKHQIDLRFQRWRG